MFVVYEIDSLRILAVSNDNARGTVFSTTDVSLMYPGVSISSITADFPEAHPGYKIIFEDDIPIGTESTDGRLFLLPKSEVDKSRNIIRQKRMGQAKFRVDGNFHRLFEEMVPSIRQIDASTLEEMRDGRFFSSAKPVGWWGSFLDAGGYANMNREIVSRLFCRGFVPIPDIYPTVAQVDKKTEKLLRSLSILRPHDSRYPKVYAFTPMPHGRHGGKSIFFTMMETSTLHGDFSRYCNTYSDEVWVPSVANAELFRNGGVRKPIKVVPLGIDEKLYSSSKRSYDLSTCKSVYGRPPTDGIGKFKFLTVIQWNLRKGYDAIIKSFVRSFHEEDDVCLVISTQYSIDTVKGTLDRYLDRKTDLPQVLLCNNVIPIDDMPSLYDSCDCYVHLSRGEGFSLTQIEAAARGLPVISCLHSGMSEYLRRDNSFVVECTGTEDCPQELSAISYFYQGQKLWRVGMEQVEQASAHMKMVVSGNEVVAERANRLRKEVLDRYTWKSAVNRVVGLLQ
jgi:glycosyltransferase involved in cell wall biosynthesis